MLPNIGFGELVVILGIALLLFGAKRLPEIAKGMPVKTSAACFRELNVVNSSRKISANVAGTTTIRR